MYDVVPAYRRAVAFDQRLTGFHIKRMILSPDQWEACTLPCRLTWRVIRFNRQSLKRVPDTFGGVYTFVVRPGIARHPACSYLLYVGKTERPSFRARYGEYLSDKTLGDRSRRPHITDMLLKWDGYLWFCYARVDRREWIEPIEQALLTAYLPPTNKEFPSTIRRVMKRIFGT